MKRYKPYTKSRREMSTISFGQFVTASEPHKALTHGFKRSMGRNNLGEITIRHKGGGHKRLFREIDFKYDKINIPYTINIFLSCYTKYISKDQKYDLVITNTDYRFCLY